MRKRQDTSIKFKKEINDVLSKICMKRCKYLVEVSRDQEKDSPE